MTVDATVEITRPPVAPEDQARASLYSLLGNLLLEVPDMGHQAAANKNGISASGQRA